MTIGEITRRAVSITEGNEETELVELIDIVTEDLRDLGYPNFRIDLEINRLMSRQQPEVVGSYLI